MVWQWSTYRLGEANSFLVVPSRREHRSISSTTMSPSPYGIGQGLRLLFLVPCLFQSVIPSRKILCERVI